MSTQLQFDEKKKIYLLPGQNLTGMVSCRVTFAHSGNVSLVTLTAGGKVFAVGALESRGHGDERDIAAFDIDPVSGECDVTLQVEGSATLWEVTFSSVSAYANPEKMPKEQFDDVQADTWEATDMLGRKVASVEDVGPKNSNRRVGVFYWTWRESHAHLRTVDVVDTLAKFPAAEYRRDHPAWGEGPFQPHWHEPFYGFYRNTDPYIIRHHAALLANAGVDMIAFDCTNGALLWKDAYEPLLEGFRQARKDGIKAPQVMFMLNFGPGETSERMLRALYQDLYKPGKYRELWFCLDGKPAIMAYPESLPAVGRCEGDTKMLNEIRSFFSFRPGQPGYGCGPWRRDQWGWLEVYPQHKYGVRADGSCEMTTVGVGQNANKDRICTHFNDVDTFGRSYTGKEGFAHLSKDSYKYGYNVQEQWDRAIDLQPDLVFVTGFNEWIMGQWHEPWLKDNDSTQLAMVDQYDREHSRDIEMDKDGYLDTYYLQLCHNIRRYKGAAPRAAVSAPVVSPMKSTESDWQAVTPVYRNNRGMTIHRDWDGFSGYHYVNDTGRNDIVEARVARDDDNVYFYVKTDKPLTKPTPDGWMSLLVDTDRDKATGWEGYDLIINRTAPQNGKTAIERYVRTLESGSWTWEKIADAEVMVGECALVLTLPRALVANGHKHLNFEFKWSDNMQAHTIMDFYANGDAAPLGRFNYLYRE